MDSLAVEEGCHVMAGHVAHEARHDDEDEHVGNLEEEDPEAEGGGENRRAGISVVAQRVKREPHGRRRAAGAARVAPGWPQPTGPRSRRDPSVSGGDPSPPPAGRAPSAMVPDRHPFQSAAGGAGREIG